MTKWKKIIWGAIFLVQLAAPLYLVWRWETTLATGRAYNFQAAPIDPFDPLRGRYIALGFAEQQGPVPGDVRLIPGQKAYAQVTVDEQGFAHIVQVLPEMPSERQNDWIRVTIMSHWKGAAMIKWPFSRYYMPEALAPGAENAYRESDKKNTWAVVRVQNGDAVIEKLFINRKDVKEQK